MRGGLGHDDHVLDLVREGNELEQSRHALGVRLAVLGQPEGVLDHLL
jgi:hypothetical protein